MIWNFLGVLRNAWTLLPYQFHCSKARTDRARLDLKIQGESVTLNKTGDLVAQHSSSLPTVMYMYLLNIEHGYWIYFINYFITSKFFHAEQRLAHVEMRLNLVQFKSWMDLEVPNLLQHFEISELYQRWNIGVLSTLKSRSCLGVNIIFLIFSL